MLERYVEDLRENLVLPVQIVYANLTRAEKQELETLSQQFPQMELLEKTLPEALLEAYPQDAPYLELVSPEYATGSIGFLGFPQGLELEIFIEDILMLSRDRTALSMLSRDAVRQMDHAVLVAILTTPS